MSDGKILVDEKLAFKVLFQVYEKGNVSTTDVANLLGMDTATFIEKYNDWVSEDT